MLKWKKIEPKKMTFDEAKALQKNGWRLPTRVELLDAYDTNIKGFFPEYYWTSTILRDHPNLAWAVGFGDGLLCNHYLRMHLHRLRPMINFYGRSGLGGA